ncbi:hypothetical protein CALCODRAFT_241893 [Calocera cornea HHB12733]|uniref:Uncharacterized protein n=1 Tax=Calocera cornea HHB12733 TaxID=1353952 RepID=A0A165GP24_9BASI|nr:hypothetical protein CALCODRAFT_241893 [Calocera cornea HHB12733]
MPSPLTGVCFDASISGGEEVIFKGSRNARSRSDHQFLPQFLHYKESNMSATTELPSVDNIVWTKAISAKGAAYETGVANVAPSKPEDDDSVKAFQRGDKNPFTIKVHWPVGDNSNKIASVNLYDIAGIMKYKLYNNPGTGNWFQYVLDVQTNMNYKYKFKDEEGDEYTIDAFVNGWHYVKYNSTAPTIIQVSSKEGTGEEKTGSE